jgi:two-component system heavy metal sensor histidine kinase CusS
VSFRSRARFVVAATTVVTLAAAFVGVSLAFRKSVDDALDVALRAQAFEEANETAALGGGRLALPESSGVYANDVEPLARYAVLYDGAGAVIAKTSAFTCPTPTRASLGEPTGQTIGLRCGELRLRGVLAGIPGHAGSVLLIAAPRAELEADVGYLRRAMLLAFAAAVLWALLAARFVTGPIVRDQEAIGAVLRRAADGDLGARVGETSRDRETLRLAADVDETIARLGGLVDAQQRFVANAAHELRSPLTTLYGELQQALRRPRSEAEYRAAIEESLASTRSLLRLSEDLLALARVGSTSAGERADVALREVVTAAAASTAAQAEAAGVRVAIEGEPRVVRGRPIELQRLARNLIENAIAHSPRGGVVRVVVSGEGEPEADGATATIEVADDGDGVAAEDAPRIFEPFYRSARSRSEGTGAGLGLSIARGIARAHGGDLVLATSSGGARFVASVAADGGSDTPPPGRAAPIR